ncbi:MAG TPA: TonB-dependent siderophore receptor [Burkholderiales bacterium]
MKVRERGPQEDYSAPTSSVGAPVPALLRDIPQTVNVVPRAVIESQGASSLTDVLRYVPGITVSAGEGGQIGNNINLRGFSARTDLYIDGMRDRGQVSRDVFFLDAVEVLKGPASMLFGRGSTGGVVNQASKQPGLRPLTEATLTLGTESYKRATIDYNRPLSETSALRIAALAHDAESTRDVVETRRVGVAPSLRFGIGTATEVTLSALLQQNRDIPDYGFPLVPEGGPGSVAKPVRAPASNFYGYTDDRFDQDIGVLGATIRHRISPTLTLRNQTQLAGYKTDANPTPLGTVSVIGGGTPTLDTPLSLLEAERHDRNRVIHDRTIFNQTDLISRFSTGPVEHTLVTGVEVGTDRYEEDRFTWSPTDVPINLGNPVNGTRPGSRFLSRQTETEADTLALYANDQLDIGRHWKVIGGLRWDRFSADTEEVTFDASGAQTGSRSESKTDRMVSTRAGLIYQPSDVASYYVSYGTSFNPSAEAVSQSARNAELDPEKNRAYEAGAKWDLLQGNLQLNAALFRVEKTNARTRDPITGLDVLEGKVRVDGLELGVVGRITPLWQVMAGYMLLDGKTVESPEVGTGNSAGISAEGKTFPNTPRHSASLWTTYRLAESWEAGGGAVYVSERFLNDFETAQVDGYTRFDATLAYRRPSYEVRLNLLNLTDERYFDTASASRAVPAEGRKALVTLTYRF